MNKLMVNALHIGIVAALAVGASACNRSADAGTQGAQSADAAQADGAQYAKVVSVTPIRASSSTPHQVCHDEVVNHTEPPKDQHNIAGTAIGAVAGGLLGHMVGGGKGKTLATVAGAAAGGYAGNRIENAHHEAKTTSQVERSCETQTSTSSKVVGYDVQYVYNGVTRTTRMDHDPGDRVRVQQGVSVVADKR